MSFDRPLTIEEQQAIARRAAREAAQENAVNQASVDSGGYTLTGNAARRANDYNYGSALGRKEFYDDPEMKALRAKNEELAKGYDGKEDSDLLQNARNEIAGQRSNYLK